MTDIREELVDTDYEAPQGELEWQVAEILADVLDVDRVGRGDSFYDFGGTSLQAIRTCARIERETGRRALPASLFEFDVLEDFVGQLPEPAAAADAAAAIASSTGVATVGPGLSDGQVGLWLSGLVAPERAAGNVIIFAYRLIPAPPASELLSAVRAFVSGSDALRTAIEADDQGRPTPRILSVDAALRAAQSSSNGTTAAQQMIAEDLARQVDLEAGPLVCVQVDANPDGSTLILAVHHACFDGHSEGLMTAALSALIRGKQPALKPAAPPPLTVPDQVKLAGWGRRLATTREIIWPPVPSGEADTTDRAAVIRFTTQPGSVDALSLRARSAGVSPFQLALQTVGRALRSATGTDSFCLGVPVSIRDGDSDLTVGNFVRQAVVPLGGDELDGSVDALSETWSRARDAAGIPVLELARLANRTAGGASRLLQVQFAWQNQTPAEWRIPGVTVTELEVMPFIPQCDLTVELRPMSDGSIDCLIESDPAVVPDETARAIAGDIRAWFEEAAA